MRKRSFGAALVAFSIVLGGCSIAKPSTDTVSVLPISTADQSKVDTLRALPMTQAGVDVTAHVLLNAGVGIYPDVPAEGKELVRLTQWQVQNLAVEAANGGGIRGATMSAIAGQPEGAPPVSYLLSAWIIRTDSPAAGFARALMGHQDWKHAEDIVFPNLVLTLFFASGIGPKPSGITKAAAVSALDGPCTAVSDFISKAINAVAGALKVDTTGGGFLGFLGSIWNVAVDLAAGVVKGILKVFKDFAFQPLIDTFAILATIQEVTSYLVKWRARPVRIPEGNRFGIGGEVVTGRVEIEVTDNQLPIPAVIRDCSKHFGADLSKLGSAEGAPVTWSTLPVPRDDLAAQTSADKTLNSQRTAKLTYRTGQETSEQAKGDKKLGIFKVSAQIQRYDLDEARRLISNLTRGALPGPAADLVDKLIAQILGAAKDQLSELTAVTVQPQLITIEYHSDPPTPSAGTPGNPAAGGPRKLPEGCPGTARISKVTGISFDTGERVTKMIPPGMIACGYTSSATRGTMNLYIGAWRAQDDAQKAAEGYQRISIPGTDHAWYKAGTSPYWQEAVYAVVGDRSIAIAVALADSQTETVVKLAADLIARPDLDITIG